MRSDRGDLNEAIASLDMEYWLDREGVNYKHTRGSSGRQANVKECPCCGNSKWKVYIGLESGLGNCFVCEQKFSRWGFIQNYLGLSNVDTVNHIFAAAKDQGWRPPRVTSVATSNTNKLALPASIALPHNGRNMKYLENRGITSSIASYFGLRYSHEGKFKYRNDDGKSMVQDYAKRIIIPIFDLEGDLVSFQGRDIAGDAEKKYLFPPGFSSTGTQLYNGQNAIGAEHVVIGEGVFDVAATKIALDGDMKLRDVVPVGSFGKHLSHGDNESQLGKLMTLKEQGLKFVTFMWDGEDKAIDAAVEAALIVHKFGLTARVAILPKDKDPNEVAPSVVRAAFWQAETINAGVATRLRLKKR
ncbi:hypothetical protein RGU72_05130 [Undibacterium sp. 5I1]|uniref:hypothetical protein n=1 Tax=unclassified Undibacterium TaxID=2630295 RepID=UPI002AB3F29F|nr:MULTISPECIES: hypothetical protein [unclassified Undibacterium]MDY7537637.1 hypothetical protein [Undibacterium sp. 5I1]MEB0230182.1 hypothetical protein [Undibacterium sp. 10I3]MEB0256374.1 hypothetical protein [Undibacterium sp. 5I1]